MKNTILASALLLAASTAFANEDKFAQLDVNADGMISIEEAASDPEISAAFAVLDTDKDGYLSPSELAQH